MIRTIGFNLALIAALGLCTALPAAAQVSVEPGVWGVNGTAQFGGAVSLQIFKTPVLPLAVEVTGAAPFDHHGFAATADLRFTALKTTFGAGIGGGDLAHNSVTPGILYDAILAQGLAPHVAVEGRFYFGPNRPGSAFAGLRFTF